ncbi:MULTISPECIES: DUF3040 domain-containing protein [Paenarthrobacter]|uniref:DUF3040 domain-containing protein n=1 Tax=Paenarthrobacter TaxID=1742992 RepID=UPI0023652171|nr:MULTISPECIES: DUF3040 domain-containing protein [Paenarthrobacter]MDD7833827.1 DUF3040 domain-containing protein [Paenarthrobacter sp. AB444]MDP9933872.1 hypothetical protein [Paenarthrobacter nicotinovorans]
MELSPSEKLELDKIAKGLESDDPKLASLMSTADLQRHRWKRTERGVLVALGGLGLLLVSFPLGSLPLGVLGFILMGGGTYWATLFLVDSLLSRTDGKRAS